MARPMTRQRVKGRPGAAQWLLMGGGVIVVLGLTFAARHRGRPEVVASPRA